MYKEEWELFVGVAFIIGGLLRFVFVSNKHLLGVLFGDSFPKRGKHLPEFSELFCHGFMASNLCD